MYIEKLVEHSIKFYSAKKIGHFEKRYLPIQITSINKNLIKGILLKKSYTDFNGVYLGRYIDFETKQTDSDSFSLSSIKEHQLNHMLNVSKYNGIVFLLVHFFKHDKTFLITIEEIINLINKGKKNIPISTFEKNFSIVNVEFPGILNFLAVINKKYLEN
ncbi:MAG: Holliday junction resolvase RecU [Malacoplasma sp.]